MLASYSLIVVFVKVSSSNYGDVVKVYCNMFPPWSKDHLIQGYPCLVGCDHRKRGQEKLNINQNGTLQGREGDCSVGHV